MTSTSAVYFGASRCWAWPSGEDILSPPALTVVQHQVASLINRSPATVRSRFYDDIPSADCKFFLASRWHGIGIEPETTFWWNFRFWLQRKLLKGQLPLKPIKKCQNDDISIPILDRWLPTRQSWRCQCHEMSFNTLLSICHITG